MVTLKQIAEQLNISITTVSKALKDYPDVSKKTRKLVRETASTTHTIIFLTKTTGKRIK